MIISKSLLGVFALSLLNTGVGIAYAADSVEEEVPCEAALAPSQGFDDNDNVQVVLHGNLPNACYQLSRFAVDKLGNNKMRIRQFAIRTTGGVCAEGGDLPMHMTMQVPFTNVISVGQLPVGDYQFVYKKPDGKRGIRALNVDVAPTPSVDSRPYAAVTGASAPDVMNTNEDLVVNIQGILNSSCTSLDPNVETHKLGDVYVVLPVVKVRPGQICMQVRFPFFHQINLGKPSAGHSLVHIRSMNGTSVNRVIDAVAPTE